MRRLLLIACLWALVSPSFAANETESFDETMQHYRKAVDDAAANDTANAAFEHLASANPGDPVVMAYLGSTWAIKARHTWFPWNKLHYADKGLGLLDKAVSLLRPEHDRLIVGDLPASVHVRSVAAITYSRLPGMFQRFDQGRDMLYELTGSSLLKTVPGPAKAHIYFFAGEAARRDNDLKHARDQYRTAMALDPQSDFARRAEKALEEMSKETR